MKRRYFLVIIAVLALVFWGCNIEEEAFGEYVPVVAVEFESTSLATTVGHMLTPVLRFTPVNATNVVTWGSSNPSVAVVNQNGLITAVSPGIAVVGVTTESGGFTATLVVTVSE